MREWVAPTIRTALLIPPVLLCDLATADEVTLSPVADTFISENYPDKNFGGMFFFNAGTTQNFTTNRGLLKFDIAASIPPGSKIVSVILTNEVVGQPDEPWNSANFGLHRMLRDWGEGDNFASKPSLSPAAGTNEASWTHRFAFTTNTWGQPGGESGVDYVAAPSETEFVYEAGLYYLFGPSSQMTADAQQWLDEPAANFGWMLIVQNETTDWTARRFGSREDPFDHPKLALTFLPPPRFSSVHRVGTNLNLSFTAEASNTYVVEFRDSIAPSDSWSTLTQIGPAGTTLGISISDSITGSQRFYRIRFP